VLHQIKKLDCVSCDIFQLSEVPIQVRAFSFSGHGAFPLPIRTVAYPDPTFHFNADPNPAFYSNADPDAKIIRIATLPISSVADP
jgi:hypothetical protein